MHRLLSRFRFFTIFTAVFLSACSFASQRFHVERYQAPRVYEKVWGVDLFNIEVDCSISRQKLVERGRYYLVSDLVFEEGAITPKECSFRENGESKKVIELIQMPERFFKYYERTDDYARIAEVIYFMGYRPATLTELLVLGADNHVPWLVYGKIVAFGSFYYRDIAFYIDRNDKGRRILIKPLGDQWRGYNVWFAVVKR